MVAISGSRIPNGPFERAVSRKTTIPELAGAGAEGSCRGVGDLSAEFLGDDVVGHVAVSGYPQLHEEVVRGAEEEG